jgi:hypothetical protein
MENTYFISDFKSATIDFISRLELPNEQVISYSRFENESSYHDWTTQIFKTRKIQKLIIPVSLPSDTLNAEGLKIALHIRLNYELSLKERLTPIIFLSDFLMDNLIKKNNFDRDCNPQYLLYTKGVSFSSFDVDEMKKKIAEENICHENDYRVHILNKLKVLPKTNVGKHSISNAWGCHKLALISGNKIVVENKEIAKDLKTLYAKYLICLNETFSDKMLCDLHPLTSSDKKILFVDDQADEGWGDLMKQIFSKNNFTYVDSGKYKNQETKQFHNFDGFYDECKSHIGKDWDLIIIDLRLHPEKEDIDNSMSPQKLSGYKLIDEFLSVNEGYQIIVFTASNKIWNINTALKRGTYSYYVKESPEFNYSIQESQEQYRLLKGDLKKCFSRKFLFEIYELHKKCNNFICNNRNKKGKYYNLFCYRASSQLEIAFELLKQSSDNKYLNFSYLSYYQILEDYANQRENFKYEDGIGYYVNDNLVVSILDKKWEIVFKDKKITKEDFHYFQRGTEIVNDDSKYKSLSSLSKISFILAHKFNKDDIFLKEWGRVNHLRNTVAVHGGNDKTVTVDDIKSLLVIVQLFLTNL